MHLNNRDHSVFNQTCFIVTVLAAGFFLMAVPNLYGQVESGGFKFFKNFTPKEYDHAAQNWGMAQAKNGMIYVANNGGVLEYDGVNWRVIYVGENMTARSLAIAEDGTVYVGGKNEIGYLEPDQKGKLQY